MTPITPTIALGIIRDALNSLSASTDTALLRELGTLATELQNSLTQVMKQTTDPRIALEMASVVETQYRAVLRAQLLAVTTLEATGAHRLTIEQYDEIRADLTDPDQPPEYVSGRLHYLDTSQLLETWLDINHWEAESRVQDAHRMVGRRTMAGEAAPPRYERLAKLYQDPQRDPREARDAARRLDKFEPTDQIQNGSPLSPSATAPDGELLEEHATRILCENPRTTAKARLDELCTAYTKSHAEVEKPEIGVFKRRTIQGVDQYLVRVEGTDAEVWRSMLAQADNRRTRAGIAARAAQETSDVQAESAPPDQTVASNHENLPPHPIAEVIEHEGNASGTADADWLRSNDPPPAWAVEPIDEKVQDSEVAPDHPSASLDQPGRRHTTNPEIGEIAESTTLDPAPQRPNQKGLSENQTNAEVAPPKRRLNAVMTLLTQCTTGNGGTPTIVPSIIVTMTLQDLLNLATAHGLTTHGIELNAGELRQLLVKARILPHVLGGQSQVLDAGRSKRFHTQPMRTALYVQDRGCIMPDCTSPPELCEVNHWPEGGWAGGCGTSVREGSLLCPREHDDFHAGKFQIVLHNGLPHVLQPRHIDPTQTPQRNKYWFPNTYSGTDSSSAHSVQDAEHSKGPPSTSAEDA